MIRHPVLRWRLWIRFWRGWIRIVPIDETWVRLDAMDLRNSHGEMALDLLGRVAFLELVFPILSRAAEAFPLRLRTLDALHLASLLFLMEQGQRVTLASYDRRLNAAAEAVDISLYFS